MKYTILDLLKKIESLEEKIKFFESESIQLKLENAELKRRLNQNSSNSHKPPSSDLFKPKPKSLIEVEDKNKKSL